MARILVVMMSIGLLMYIGPSARAGSQAAYPAAVIMPAATTELPLLAGATEPGRGGEVVTDDQIEPTLPLVNENFRNYILALTDEELLGDAKAEAYAWQGEIRQDFIKGTLVWRPEAGVRRLGVWADGQLVQPEAVGAGAYLLRDQRAYQYLDADQQARCQPGATSTKVDAAGSELFLKQYPLAGVLPDCQSPAEQRAIAWAKAELLSARPAWSDVLGSWWSGQCEAFVEVAYGTRQRADSAWTHYQFRLQKGQIHTDVQPPAGAFVFYAGQDGHTGIALGDGTVISTQGYAGNQLPVWRHHVTGLTNGYLGWARYDGTWPR